MKKAILAIGTIFAMLLASGSSWAEPEVFETEESGGNPEWTLIYYLAADNDQEAYADNTIIQLQAGTAGVENHPQVLVMIDRLSTSGTEIFEIEAGEIIPLESLEEQNTADGAVLQDLATYALNQADYDKVAMVIKSEGLAWRGIGRDNTHAEDLPDQLMNNSALAEGLVNAQTTTGKDLDLLVLEGSLMAFMETIYDLRDAAPIVLASQSKIQLEGMPWDVVIDDLGAQPGMTNKELGIAITDDHIEYYNAEGNKGDSGDDTFTNFAALTVFDLSPIQEVLAAHNDWAETSWLLFDDIYTYMAHARDLSGVGGLNHVTSADFQHDVRTHMVECVRLLEEDGLSFPELNAAVDNYLVAQDQLVVYERSADSGDQLGATTGLGIWFPPTWLQYDTSDLEDDAFGSDYDYEDPTLNLNWTADSNWINFLYEYFNRADSNLEGNGVEGDDPPKKGVFDQINSLS